MSDLKKILFFYEIFKNLLKLLQGEAVSAKIKSSDPTWACVNSIDKVLLWLASNKRYIQNIHIVSGWHETKLRVIVGMIQIWSRVRISLEPSLEKLTSICYCKSPLTGLQIIALQTSRVWNYSFTFAANLLVHFLNTFFRLSKQTLGTR